MPIHWTEVEDFDWTSLTVLASEFTWLRSGVGVGEMLALSA